MWSPWGDYHGVSWLVIARSPVGLEDSTGSLWNLFFSYTWLHVFKSLDSGSHNHQNSPEKHLSSHKEENLIREPIGERTFPKARSSSVLLVKGKCKYWYEKKLRSWTWWSLLSPSSWECSVRSSKKCTPTLAHLLYWTQSRWWASTSK